MKKTILFFLGFGLMTSFVQAQTSEQVHRYAMEVACDCMGKHYNQSISAETRELAKKITSLPESEVNAFLETLGDDKITAYIDAFGVLGPTLETNCSEADMKAIVLKKYPNAGATVDAMNQDMDPNEGMALMESVPQCVFLKEMMVSMMTLSIYQASKTIDTEEIILDDVNTDEKKTGEEDDDDGE